MDEVQRQQFVKQLGALLRENFPVTDEFLRKELDSQLAGNKPAGIMGMFIADNLKKVSGIES